MKNAILLKATIESFRVYEIKETKELKGGSETIIIGDTMGI